VEFSRCRLRKTWKALRRISMCTFREPSIVDFVLSRFWSMTQEWSVTVAPPTSLFSTHPSWLLVVVIPYLWCTPPLRHHDGFGWVLEQIYWPGYLSEYLDDYRKNLCWQQGSPVSVRWGDHTWQKLSVVGEGANNLIILGGKKKGGGENAMRASR